MRKFTYNISSPPKNPTKFRRFPPPSSGGRWRPTFLHVCVYAHPPCPGGGASTTALRESGGGASAVPLKLFWRIPLEFPRIPLILGLPKTGIAQPGTQAAVRPLLLILDGARNDRSFHPFPRFPGFVTPPDPNFFPPARRWEEVRIWGCRNYHFRRLRRAFLFFYF